MNDAVQKGRLREDLLYRMDVFSITIPPLRERTDDIAPLAAEIIELYDDSGLKRKVSDDAMEMLLHYHWPGNIRELKSVLTKAMIFADDDLITSHDLPRYLSEKGQKPTSHPHTLEEMEKKYIIDVLAKTGGNQSKAAEVLGINRKTLYKKIHKFKIFS